MRTMLTRTRRFVLAAFIAVLPASMVMATEVWQTLPPMPTRPAPAQEGYAAINGIELYYATYGSGPPVLLLHGGLGNSDYWGKLIPVLASNHKVIVMDSRGHGRSTRDAQPYSYDLMASDVLGLMDFLGISQADIVGWSDGGIIGLDIAMNHPGRIGRLFAFGANSTLAGLKKGFDTNPTFAAYIERAGQEYAQLSQTPTEYDDFLNQVGAMWGSQPNWSAADLARIKTPVMIADGEHDEAIRREHTEELARQVPGAELLILPGVSHFAMLQDPALFNRAVVDFLAQ